MIRIMNVNKNYGKKKILQNISMTFQENKVNFLMGKNGSGKTTLIKCITDLEKYDGVIEFDGEPFRNKRSETLVLWDDCPFYDSLTGLENLVLLGEKKHEKKQIIDIVSEFVGEELLSKKVKTYSYGQKKKLGLALALILEPSYIFMDEISNGLDYDTLILLKQQIKKWTEEKTVILTGHQFSFYNDIVDNVCVYNKDGGVNFYADIKESGKTLEEIYNETMH